MIMHITWILRPVAPATKKSVSNTMAMKEPSNDEVHSGALSNHEPQLVAFTDSLAAFSANLDDSIREIHDRCLNSDGGES
jgi:hypothetical protein